MKSRHDDALAGAILETVRLPLLALDADLCVETANDAFLRQFRVTREETMGRRIYDLGNGQWDIPELRRLLGEVLAEKSTVTGYRVEHHFERIGRRIMHVDARRIVRSGEPDLILIAISDDTEREALRAELIGRVEFADKLIDSVREGLLILDPDLRVHSASASFYDTFGVDPGETVGRLVYELGNGQWDIPELRHLLEDVLPRQRSFDDYEVTQSFEGIGERAMVLNGRRLDHMDLILLAIRDVTSIRESAARSKEVARAAHVGVFESDLRAGTTYWSPEMRDIVGYPQDRPPPPAGTVPDVVHPEDRPAMADMFAEVLDPHGGGLLSFEHRIVRPDGEVRWVQMKGRVEFAEVDGERRPVLMRGVLLDVTDRNVAEQAVLESEERHQFLLELSDALRAAPDADAVAEEALGRLRERLRLDRCYIVTYDHTGERVDIPHQVGNDLVPPLPDHVRMAEFPEAVRIASDRTLVIPDVAATDGLSETDRRNLQAFGLGGVVAPALRRGEGTPLWGMAAISSRPRNWTGAEIALVEEVAERTWAAMQRARAEAALSKSEARLRKVLDTETVGVVFFDLVGGIQDANDAFLAMVRHSRAELEAGKVRYENLTPPEWRWRDEKTIAELKATGRAGPYEKEHTRGDGTKFWILCADTMLDERTAVEFVVDVTERKRAEAALTESEERFRHFGEASSDALWIRDADTLDWEYLSPAFERIYGMPREEALRRRSVDVLLDLIVPEDRDAALSALRELRGGDRSYDYRIRRPSDGELRWLRTTGFRLAESDGGVRRLGGITQDVTGEKRAAERTEVLLAELQHRTRNLIGVVRAISSRTRRSAKSLDEFQERFGSRLEALARANSLLSRHGEGDQVTFDELLTTELQGHGIQIGQIADAKVTAAGPKGISLPSTSVQTLALALHELLTNASKHGALRRPEGNLSISWGLTGNDGRQLRVEWRESGLAAARPIHDATPGSGFGRELIERALAHQLGATVLYELNPDGLTCVIELPSRDGADGGGRG